MFSLKLTSFFQIFLVCLINGANDKRKDVHVFATVGEQLILKCNSPTYHFKNWLKNGNPFTSYDGIQVNQKLVQFEALTLENEGNHTCSSGEVHIFVWVVEPYDYYAELGKSFKIFVVRGNEEKRENVESENWLYDKSRREFHQVFTPKISLFEDYYSLTYIEILMAEVTDPTSYKYKRVTDFYESIQTAKVTFY